MWTTTTPSWDANQRAGSASECLEMLHAYLTPSLFIHHVACSDLVESSDEPAKCLLFPKMEILLFDVSLMQRDSEGGW